MSTQLSVVIPAYNEEKTIGRLIRKLERWPRKPEIVVVANGCTDRTAAVVRETGARLIEFTESLGHDVGRAIGLSVATGDVCVVIDGDMLFSPADLEPYVQAVDGGVDIALNRYPMPGMKHYSHMTAVAKRAVNILTDRDDLNASSLTAVPHALSRRAVEQLGWKAFSVPPVAQVQAHMAGLRVSAVHLVPVGAKNPVRKRPKDKSVSRLIVGDCLEAISLLTEQRGARAGYTDLDRKRDVLEVEADTVGVSPDGPPRPPQEDITADPSELTQFQPWTAGRGLAVRRGIVPHSEVLNLAVIPVYNEEQTIGKVIQNVKQSGLNDIHVVCNGTTDRSRKIANAHGASLVCIGEPLGHDVGRGVGYLTRQAQRYLFLDGDIVLGPQILREFVHAMDRADVALNDLDEVMSTRQQAGTVTVVRRFLNLALEREDLGAASMTAVPHAMHREVIEAIGAHSLAVPPLAQVKAILAGFQVAAVHPVNVMSKNRFQRELHGKRHGKPWERLVLGDHLEAFHFMLSELGPRGLFPDKIRKRAWLEKWRKQLEDTPDNRSKLPL
ncbi:glycosyltransferase [Alicyclobacillus sp. SO9]|uniref:glycosyltransferase n=1 Tax=Alicyclobacillus sp. SO9 TaxID=2665646 RepID=UPI0018E7B40F|nr:glycosyltransferase [Alicyclobacillus sp. SO9]QQE79940.1 glycosyltransferase [Alicyclobacillus sp. SO9]